MSVVLVVVHYRSFYSIVCKLFLLSIVCVSQLVEHEKILMLPE